MTTYIAVPERDAEAAQEAREFHRLAQATDKRITAQRREIILERAEQEAKARQLEKIQRKRMQHLWRVTGYMALGSLSFAAARLGLMNAWLALGIVGGCMVALGGNLCEAVKLSKATK